MHAPAQAETTSLTSIRVARAEFKYHVPARLVPAIRDSLLRYCQPDQYSRLGDWYSIRSLYLDSSDLRLYRDAKESLPFRFKLRARVYGDADGGSGSVKLEVKRRLRELIVKTSASLPSGIWQNAFAEGLPGLHDAATPAMGEFLQLTESSRARPRMLVYYERQAFSSLMDKYVRVTFDRSMKCQPMHQWNLAGSPRQWLCVDTPSGFGEFESPVVMEIKFENAPPAWLRDLVLDFQLERRGFSKYCRAVERALLNHEPAWDVAPLLLPRRHVA